jgi:hypothetical protein
MRGLWLLPLLLLVWAPARASAQDPDSLRAALRLPVPPAMPSLNVRRPAPAVGANSPTAFGAGFGDLFVGASYAARARNVDAGDGTVAAGIGLGDPWRWVGVEVDVISFSTIRSGWGNRMGVDLILHRILPGGFGVALGWESLLQRGMTDGDRSRYAVVSKWWQLRESESAWFNSLVLSSGVGDGRFRAFEDWQADRQTVNWFGSAALRVAGPLSVIADWTGQDLMLAGSVAPFTRFPLVVSAGLADLTERAGDGARFVATASYSVDLRTIVRR